MKTKILFIAVTALMLSRADAQQMFTVDVKGQGKPIIFIHGLYCSGEVWNETVDRYKKNYECHVLTLAGFGGNAPKLSEHFLEDVKNDVVAYAKKLKKPILVGHSMGGFISFWAAASGTGVFEKVIAVDGLPFLTAIQMPGSTSETAKPMAATVKSQMGNQTPEQIEAGQKMYLPTMITSPERIAQVAKIASRSDSNTQAEVMYEMLTTDLRQTVSSIDCPVLLMGAWIGYKQYGATHERVEKGYAQQVATIKNAKVEITDTAKHFIFYDEPAWFYEKLDAFLK
ncbi:MAG: alpha/beta hydrolase [Bacteroidetes bacterium]|nr:alpha/beta hydrolase [Bacteroidota bacterium]MBS1540512.1 alpha/beta hydrolase [Bacteroidota bacterium]